MEKLRGIAPGATLLVSKVDPAEVVVHPGIVVEPDGRLITVVPADVPPALWKVPLVTGSWANARLRSEMIRIKMAAQITTDRGREP
jgi:hypothetical protein